MSQMKKVVTFIFVLISQVVFSIIMAFYISPIPTIVTEIFPAHTRYTGMSLASNIAAAIFGGTTPMLITTLIGEMDSYYPISFYLVFATSISFACVCEVKRRYNQNRLYLI